MLTPTQKQNLIERAKIASGTYSVPYTLETTNSLDQIAV